MLVSLTDERPGPVPCLFLSIRCWLKLVYRRETSVFCVIKTLKREGLYAIPTVARSVGVVRGPAESSEFRPLPIDSEDKTKLCLWACMGLSVAFYKPAILNPIQAHKQSFVLSSESIGSGRNSEDSAGPRTTPTDRATVGMAYNPSRLSVFMTQKTDVSRR